MAGSEPASRSDRPAAAVTARPGPLRPGPALAGAVGFGLLVLLNAGGYRYGVSDQAFYVPVVLHELSPELFPHDAPVIAAQDRFFAFDDWFAPMLRLTGLSLPTGFLIAYGVSLTLLFGAIVGLGRGLYTSHWTVAGLVIGLTMRHRIPDTAVNSLEGYFHPRLLAFAIGLWAVVLFLRGGTWRALALTGIALLVHPTTALWFVVLVGVAGLAVDTPQRPRLLAAAGLASVVGVALLAGPLRGGLVVMNRDWLAVLAVKDYLNPLDWPLSTWLAHLSLVGVIGAGHHLRRRLGLAAARETGLVIGCGVLFGLFVVSVPLTDARVALVVQLQLNRIFWLLDVLASAYMGWWLIESPTWPRFDWPGLRAVPRRAVVGVVLILALWRGVHVSFIDPAGRPIAPNASAAADWHTVMEWAQRQPVGTHFLADPGHASLYGRSVRVAGERDVYLEVVKDVGMAIYSADIARRVGRRLDDLGHFASLDAGRARGLARDYELDFLITEHPIDLPETRRFGRFHVYALGPSDRPPARPR